VRDDWGAETAPDRFAGGPGARRLAVYRIAKWLLRPRALTGIPVGRLRDHDKQIPILARLREGERGTLASLSNLYVLGSRGSIKVPLLQVANLRLEFAPEKIMRRNQVRTVVGLRIPVPGRLPSEVMKLARARLQAFERSLPPGYFLEIGGAQEQQTLVFRESGIVALLSVLAILLSLVIQFRQRCEAAHRARRHPVRRRRRPSLRW